MEFYTYNSTAQKEHFSEIDIFTADKNTLQFSATVYWFIRYLFVFITARIRRMWEGNVFTTVCLFTGGGGYPS